MKIHTHSRKLIGDLATPVSLYLKIREKYGQALLLETSAYSVREGSTSMICFNTLGTISITEGKLNSLGRSEIQFDIYKELSTFMGHFEIDKNHDVFNLQAVFGYTCYSAVQYFEQIKFDLAKRTKKYQSSGTISIET